MTAPREARAATLAEARSLVRLMMVRGCPHGSITATCPVCDEAVGDLVTAARREEREAADTERAVRELEITAKLARDLTWESHHTAQDAADWIASAIEWRIASLNTDPAAARIRARGERE